MKKLKITLEYHCFPVWIYDDNGELINNDLPEELMCDEDIDDAFVEIQKIYDNLFLNNSTEFQYIGFKNEFAKQRFLKKIEVAIELIKAKVGDTYIIEKEIVI